MADVATDNGANAPADVCSSSGPAAALSSSNGAQASPVASASPAPRSVPALSHEKKMDLVRNMSPERLANMRKVCRDLSYAESS